MSPVAPISPTSPMDYSPITPSPKEQYHFDLSAAPVTPPSVHLPKLVTSFHNATSAYNDARRLSVPFQLPTPSPLSLRQETFAAVQRRASAPWHRCFDAVSPNIERGNPERSFYSLTALISAPVRNFPKHNEPISASSFYREPPTLRREYANEGLDAMLAGKSSPIIEQIMNLPLRLAPHSAQSEQPKSETPQSPVQQLSTQIQLARSSGLNSGAQDVSRCEVGVLSGRSRVQSRSPIHKHRRRCERLQQATDTSPKLHIRKPQTKQQQLLQSAIEYYSSELVPLISLIGGQPHPEFPRNLLQYHLLTHEQLDSLARWYHQTLDGGELRWKYPCPLKYGKVWCGSAQTQSSTYDNGKKQVVDIVTKRRRWGRFIGLQRCESPEEEDGSITARMEEEMREALRKAEEEAKLQEKLWGRRFG